MTTFAPAYLGSMKTPPAVPRELTEFQRARLARKINARIAMQNIRPRRIAVVLETGRTIVHASFKMASILRAKAFADPKNTVTLDQITGPCRKRAFIKVRHRVCWFLRVFCDWSFPKIALAIGGRDHATIMHAVSNVNRQMRLPHDYRTPLGAPSVTAAILVARKAFDLQAAAS